MAKACSAECIGTDSLLPARNPPHHHPSPSSVFPLSVFGRILSDDWLSRVKGSRVHGSHFWPFVKHRDALFCKFCLGGSSAWRRRTRLDVFQHHIRLDSVSWCCSVRVRTNALAVSNYLAELVRGINGEDDGRFVFSFIWHRAQKLFKRNKLIKPQKSNTVWHSLRNLWSKHSWSKQVYSFKECFHFFG